MGWLVTAGGSVRTKPGTDVRETDDGNNTLEDATQSSLQPSSNVVGVPPCLASMCRVLCVCLNELKYY